MPRPVALERTKTAIESKKVGTPGTILRAVYEALSDGDPGPMIDALAEDVTWTIIGTTPLSGAYRGKDDVIERLFGGLRSRLSTGVEFSIERVIEQGDDAVLVASGRAIAKSGRPYNNSYCVVARVVEGRLVEMTDYVDTELVNSALFGDE
jgi:ketosteroid isomerase-like protein